VAQDRVEGGTRALHQAPRLHAGSGEDNSPWSFEAAALLPPPPHPWGPLHLHGLRPREHHECQRGD
jgi:hypothetical protein